MTRWLGKVAVLADAWRDADSGELGLGFTTAELEANRRGELLGTQYPPLFWKLVGLCLLGLVFALCLRWAFRHRHEPPFYFGAAIAIACLVPAGLVANGLASALRDRIEARACSFTNVATGVRNSHWGLGLYYLAIGDRAFYSRRGSPARAVRAVEDGTAYTAYFACQSETLASLEPAPPDWKPPQHMEHLAELEQLFGFDDADLAANRSGTINLGQYPFRDLAGVLFFVALFGLPALACALQLRERFSVLPLLLGLLCGALSLAMAYGNRALIADVVARRACALEGAVTKLVLGPVHKGIPKWQLSIAGTTLEFRRSSDGLSLIRVGSSYRVHYLCRSQHLLSIEPLQ